MSIRYSQLLTEFENRTLDPTGFGHCEHIQVAFEMLHKYDYVEACTNYAAAISEIAAKAGAPEKFNVTITFAFLSLIAERVATTGAPSFAEFVSQNEDLMSRSALSQWYSRDELQSDFARTHFLLPRQVA